MVRMCGLLRNVSIALLVDPHYAMMFVCTPLGYRGTEHPGRQSSMSVEVEGGGRRWFGGPLCCVRVGIEALGVLSFMPSLPPAAATAAWSCVCCVLCMYVLLACTVLAATARASASIPLPFRLLVLCFARCGLTHRQRQDSTLTIDPSSLLSTLRHTTPHCSASQRHPTVTSHHIFDDVSCPIPIVTPHHSRGHGRLDDLHLASVDLYLNSTALQSSASSSSPLLSPASND